LTPALRLTFSKDGKMTLLVSEKDNEGKYKLGQAGQVDVAAGTPEFSQGIYKFDGNDRLTICFTTDPKAEKRPTTFTGEKDSGQVLLELARAKPGEEKPTAKELELLRELAGRAEHQNNLHQIGVAMHNYLNVYRVFPLHAIYSKDGMTPLLSWRVAILPFIEGEDLYKQFKLDEPWDSDHNKKLIAKMPAIFEPLGAGKKGEGKTHYQVFTGPDTLFDGNKKMRLLDVKDGTANTILVIEAKNPVIWTKPEDLVLPRAGEKMPAVGGLFKDRVGVVFADGSRRWFVPNPDPVELRAAVTPRGAEPINMDKLELKPAKGGKQ
jgi:hypothetical protein